MALCLQFACARLDQFEVHIAQPQLFGNIRELAARFPVFLGC